MNQRRNRLYIILGLGLVAILLGILMRPVPYPVEVATVERRPLVVTVDEQGRTRARNPYVVMAPIGGKLLRTEFNEGDRVREGQKLADIALAPEDRRSEAMAEANLEAAEAFLQAAKAALAEAETAYARAKSEEQRREELYKKNLVSAEEREHYRQVTDAAEAHLLSAQASLQAARAEVEGARSRLLGMGLEENSGVISVPAPVDGTVYRVFEENERVVQAGTPLFEISNRDDLEMVVDLLTQDAVKVKPGNPILISGWGGEEVLHAIVSYIEPAAFTKVSALGVEEQRVNVVGELLDAPPSLGAGYRIEVAIITHQEDGVLSMPSSAIFQRGNTWQSYVVSNGEAELRDVEIGLRGRDFAEVLSGINPGERVIVYPSDLIEEGIQVSVE